MAATAVSNEGDSLLKQATSRNTRGMLRVIILALIAGAAVSSRLFSVIRFESIIHECELLPVENGGLELGERIELELEG